MEKIIFLILGAVVVCIVWGIVILANRDCLKSHIEEQWEMPASVVIGGGKYGGGVGVPIGNARKVVVEVCDQYK